MEITPLIDALSQPSAYTYPVAQVEVRQTHISVVFLAGSYVYKIKKPVKPGFLDFSSLDKRRHFCDEEVRLNRRLAPRVYLGIVPVVLTPEGCCFEGEREVVEWAVKMQRLPDASTLQEHLRRDEVSVELVKTLAGRIASFHQIAETNERIAAFGRFDAVARIIRDVFEQARPQLGITVSANIFGRVKDLAEDALASLRPLIDDRAARGRTRDCHGDLHLDHVYSFPDSEPPDELVIIDCIEFNERFRFIDPVYDMAFTAMDFAFCGRRDLASVFTDAYFHAAGDEEGRPLLPLYIAYRAAIRGLVDGLLFFEREATEADHAAARERSSAHWLLALAELEQPDRKPCLVLIMGLPGAGKSTLARALAEKAGLHVIRSDVVRKELANQPDQGRTQTQESLYTREWHDRTYAECLLCAERLIRDGNRAIVDANFRQEKDRRAFREAAVRCGVPICMIHCQASAETARRRLEGRKGDVSDADWSVYLHATESWEEFGAATQRVLRTISTEGCPEQALSESLQVLREFDMHQ